jgi:YlmC/YmxH family sporulation protein
MRLSEFADKRIINLFNGEIMGSAGDSDLLIDPSDGHILEIILQPPTRLMTRGEKQSLSIPWSAVKKIGPEIIVVDIEDADISHR